jgi:hypothetical protein
MIASGGQGRDQPRPRSNRRGSDLEGNSDERVGIGNEQLFATSAIPNGERRPPIRVDRKSAMPSPLVSRSKVMRFGLGTAEPAFFSNFWKK